MFRHRPAALGWSADSPIAAVMGEQPWAASFPRSPVPLPGHVVLRSRDGRVEELRARSLSRPSDRYHQVDVRRRLLTLAPQSIATAEGVDVAVTAAIAVRAADPAATVRAAADPDAEVYLAVQIALRDAVAACPLESVLVREVPLDRVLDAARTVAADVGLRVESVQLKDVRAPGALSAAREDALVQELRGATELERARAEVKATRARLAAAQMLERSPVLARLRLLEAMPPGTTLKVAGLDAAPGVPGAPMAPADEPASS